MRRTRRSAAKTAIVDALAIDTETTLISEDEPIPRLVCATISDGSDSVGIVAHDPDLESHLREAFRGRTIFANVGFDIPVILRRFPALYPDITSALEAGRVHDVILQAKMVDIAAGEKSKTRRYNLGALVERYLPEDVCRLDKSDPWRTRYADLLGVAWERWPDGARAYALEDARATALVWQALQFVRGRWSFDPAHDEPRQVRAAVALAYQTARGICTDAARVDALDRRLEREILESAIVLEREGLARWGGTKKSPRLVRNTAAIQELIERVATERGVEVPQTKRGASTSESTIKSLGVPHGHPLAHAQRYGSLRTLRSKAIPPLRAPVVRTDYDPLLETGRTSARGSKLYPSTNLQNQPRSGGFRECLVPRPGCVFVISDWSMAELVALAQIQVWMFGRSALADALRDGRDPHAELGATIAGVASLDELEPSDRKRYRTLAKAPNFGYPGGLGVARFVAFVLGTYGIDLSQSEASALRDKWRRQWPEMVDYHRAIGDLLDRCNDTIVLGATGFARVASFTEGCNFLFQALAAACAKDSLWRLWREGSDPSLGSPLYGSHQVLFVHDEHVTECEASSAERVRDRQEEIMVDAFAGLCPDVPVRVESSIVDRYQK